MSIAKRTLIVVGVLCLLLALFRPFVIVGPGERAVIFDLARGVLPTQFDEGFHFLMPFVNHAEIYDVRRQTYSVSRTSWEGEVKGDDSIRVLTADGQEASVELSVRFHIDPNKVWRLHKEIGKDYVNKILRPEIRSHIRIALAEYPAADAYSTQRRTIQNNIETRLRDKLAGNYIVVDEVLLRAVSFSDAFQNAIIQKQIAQQEAQRMQYVLEKAERERQRKILLAEGEAEAMRLKGQAIAINPKVVSYSFVQKVGPNIRGIVTSGSLPTPNLNASGQ
jgi:regulator of protease activity HflC (stomatin/prohibitin superfamily)